MNLSLSRLFRAAWPRVAGIAGVSLLLIAGVVTTTSTAYAGGEEYFPLQSYRVGPYAAGGTGFFGGFIDYMKLINTRDGGVNGAPGDGAECEHRSEPASKFSKSPETFVKRRDWS